MECEHEHCVMAGYKEGPLIRGMNPCHVFCKDCGHYFDSSTKENIDNLVAHLYGNRRREDDECTE